MYATTLEGTPEAAPQNVECTALSSQSIKITWIEPPLQFHGGIIQGYKILYRPLVHEGMYCVSQIKSIQFQIYLHLL